MTVALAFLLVILVGLVYSILPLRQSLRAIAHLRESGKNGRLLAVAKQDLHRDQFKTFKAACILVVGLSSFLPNGAAQQIVSGEAFLALTLALVVSILLDRIETKRIRAFIKDTL